jgi:hypothetical protein
VRATRMKSGQVVNKTVMALSQNKPCSRCR